MLATGITDGHLMALVAVVGHTLMSSAWTRRRSAFFKTEEAWHLEVWLAQSPTSPNWPDPRLAYHAYLSAKYECAARYPWLSVEPDLREPK